MLESRLLTVAGALPRVLVGTVTVTVALTMGRMAAQLAAALV